MLGITRLKDEIITGTIGDSEVVVADIVGIISVEFSSVVTQVPFGNT